MSENLLLTASKTTKTTFNLFLSILTTRVFFNSFSSALDALKSISTFLHWCVIPNMITKRWLVLKFLNIVITHCDWFLKFLNTAVERCGFLHTCTEDPYQLFMVSNLHINDFFLSFSLKLIGSNPFHSFNSFLNALQ